MTPTHELTAIEPVRLDVFLARHIPHYSRSKLQRLIIDGKAVVNDAVVREPRYGLQVGDSVCFTEPEPSPDFPAAEPGELIIIFEDDALLVIDKPAGIVVHPNTFEDTGTLVQRLLAERPEIKHALYDANSSVSRLRPGIVHRLDKDTSGLMIVAKSREAMLALTEQFHKREVHKEYETLLYGRLKSPETVQAPIHRKGGGTSSLMVASHDPGQGRSAVTHFTPEETYVPYEKWPDEVVTKVRVKIETGRTHQIRVHAKFIGHPVMGDQLYCNKPSKKLSDKLGLTTQVLRAVSLEFIHPLTKKRLSFSLS